jgi:hypothetical protein
MSKEIIEKMKILKNDIHNILCNRLTYPKSVIGIAKERHLTESEIDKIKTCIDEGIKLVDAKLIEFLDEAEKIG